MGCKQIELWLMIRWWYSLAGITQLRLSGVYYECPFPTLRQFYMPFYVKRKKNHDYICQWVLTDHLTLSIQQTKLFKHWLLEHAVSANRILWVYAGFWWYHGILVVHLQDSVGAFWAIKDQDTSIRGLSVENVMTDGLSRVCIWWCIMLSLITKITGIYFVGEKC